MNRILSILIIFCLLLSMSACKKEQEAVTLADGTYTMEQSGEDELFCPNVMISYGRFSFTYDFLRSYKPIGTYTIEGDTVTMETDDKKLKFVFRVDGDTLIFQEKESSKIDSEGDYFTVKIPDQAKFILDKEP